MTSPALLLAAAVLAVVRADQWGGDPNVDEDIVDIADELDTYQVYDDYGHEGAEVVMKAVEDEEPAVRAGGNAYRYATAGTTPRRRYCEYRYPEQHETEALLGNMMNELTKVFVKVSTSVHGAEAQMAALRARGAGAGAGGAGGVGVGGPRGKRFNVVKPPRNDFFEQVYSNMTKEFVQKRSQTLAAVAALRQAPCQHQSRLRWAWARLLTAGRRLLRRAAARLLRAATKTRMSLRSGDDAADRSLLLARAADRAFVLRELAPANLHRVQLRLLCQRFNLCFHDLPAPTNPPTTRTTRSKPQTHPQGTTYDEVISLWSSSPSPRRIRTTRHAVMPDYGADDPNVQENERRNQGGMKNMPSRNIFRARFRSKSPRQDSERRHQKRIKKHHHVL